VPARRPGASGVPLDDNLAIYDDVGQLLNLLNTTAAGVWERCDGGATFEEMVRALVESHDAPPEVIAHDAWETVRKLAELGLVVDAAEQA
jgi:hypothetical protein